MTRREDDGSFPAGQRFFAVALVGLFLACGAGARGASEVPFIDSFDYPDGTSLDGTNGWGAAGNGSAIATNGRARLIGVKLSNAFSPVEKEVMISFEIQPIFKEDEPPGVIPNDAVCAFYVRTNGLITAYNGATATNLVHEPLSENSTTQIRVRLDYPLKKWSLWVGETAAATNYGFYSQGASAFSEVVFMEGSTNRHSFVDDVSIEEVVYSLPFYEPFEARQLGDLDKQHGWDAVDAEVTDAPAYVHTGSQACIIRSGTGVVSHTFNGSHSNVWSDLWIKPAFGAGVTNPPAGSSHAFYVHTNGHIVVFDGATPKQLAAQVTAGAWVRFTVNSDYVNSKWALYVNGTPVDTDLDFSDPAAPVSFTEFGVSGGDVTNVPLDDVAITLTDPLADVPPSATFAVGAMSRAESILSATGTVVLSRAYTGTVSVAHVLIDDGAAVAGQDYTNYTPGTLTFAPGQTTNTFTFEIINDIIDDGPDTLVFGLGSYSNASPGLYTNFAYTILWDASDQPRASFLVDAASGPESVMSVTGTVVLSKVYTSTVTVDHAIIDAGGAVAGQDYTYTPGTLTFDPGQMTNTFTFEIINDTDDDEETIVFGLGNYGNAFPGLYTNFAYTILRDTEDIPPGISFVTNAYTAAESVAFGTGTVYLTKSYSGTVTVEHGIHADSTAMADSDFTNYASGTLTFAPGQMSTSFTYTVINDSEHEPDETIVFALSNFVNCVPGLYTDFTHTILADRDDGPPFLTFAMEAVSYAETVASGTATLNLSWPPARTVTVEHAVLAGSTAVFGADYTNYTPGTLTFEPGQASTSFTFTVVDDDESEDDETIVFGLSSYSNCVPGLYTNFTYTILSRTWYSLPFTETFEARDLGDLDGQYGWLSQNAVVQTNVVFEGVKAASLTTLTNSVRHIFRDGKRDVWTDLYVQPVFGGRPSGIPPGSTFVLYVTTNGHITAYDGSTSKNLTPPAPQLTEGQWVRFSIHSDYVNNNWDLYVNGKWVVSDFSFYSTPEPGAGYSEFGIQTRTTTNGHLKAYLDNLYIGEARPMDIPELMIIIW
jgi:hypothetical protein